MYSTFKVVVRIVWTKFRKRQVSIIHSAHQDIRTFSSQEHSDLNNCGKEKRGLEPKRRILHWTLRAWESNSLFCGDKTEAFGQHCKHLSGEHQALHLAKEEASNYEGASQWQGQGCVKKGNAAEHRACQFMWPGCFTFQQNRDSKQMAKTKTGFTLFNSLPVLEWLIA